MAKLTPEQARELGRRGGQKSAEARRARKNERQDLLARARFTERSDDMAKVLIEAALGQGDFAKLPPKERAQFALKALEYGMGRPRPMDAPEPEVVEQASGLAFGVAEALDDETQDAPEEDVPGPAEAEVAGEGS